MDLRLNLKRTRDIRNPHEYVAAVHGECAEWVFDEEVAPQHRGQWNSVVFNNEAPLDLEIGTGNGFFFAQRALAFPSRNLVGIEVKYKPLIQAARRAVRAGARNFKILRYDGRLLSDLFNSGELNDVFIHHPDPWHKKRQSKRRLMNSNFLQTLFELQKPGGTLEFKTDSRDYFDWSVEQIKATPYEIDRFTYDLYCSEWHRQEDETHFQRLFHSQKVPINYLTLKRN